MTRFLALLAALPLMACSRDDDARRDPPTPIVAQRRAATARPDSLGEGDIRIVTVDGAVDLAMIGDTISTGLGAKALEKVRLETDTAKVSGSGFGASIEKMVKRTVASSIGTRVAFPVAAVSDVRYEGGALKFAWAGKPPQVFVNTKVNGRPVLESFAPADAQAFVDAFRARKLGTRTQM